MTVLKRSIRVNEFLFGISFIVLFIALFLEDVAFTVDVSPIIKLLKMSSLALLVVSTVYRAWRKSTFKELLIVFFVGCVVLVCTGDFFLTIVVLLSYNSMMIDDGEIFRLSFVCCLVGVGLTLLLFAVGLLPDVLSYRTDFSAEARHAFGFQHSAILPLIICYMLCYYIGMNGTGGKIKGWIVVVFLLLGVFTYKYCKSRNAVVGILALSLFALAMKSSAFQQIMNRPVQFVSKWITLFCMSLAILPAFLRAKGVLLPLWHVYDSIFTNRSLLGASAIDSYGIHLINRMTYSAYAGFEVNVDSYVYQGIVLDSAYMYMLVRYGILILLFFYIVLTSFYRREKTNTALCAVFCIVVLLNMTDNDMLSYGCLPFLLIGIKNIWNKRLDRG